MYTGRSCWLCGRNGTAEPLDKHHIFGGAYRKKSEKYRDADAAAGYQRERRALGMTQVEDDFTVQHAPVPEKITPMQLEALEKFIVFGGEG